MTKTEIKKTRIGGLGSSDARMVAKIAKNGCLSDSDRQRIAIMLGIEEKPEFSTTATEYGNYIEDRVFEIIKQKYPNAVSNPFYQSEELSEKYGFGIFNHIDYEVEIKDKLIWIENKATKKTLDECYFEYQLQLSWHNMLLREKAQKLGKKPVLLFSHYFVDEYSEYFIDKNYTIKSVFTPESTVFEKGFEIISESIKDFKYDKRETLYADNLPVSLQDKLFNIAECFKRITESEKQIENFKEKMLVLMSNSNVKSIQNDFFRINLINESITSNFDKKLFETENPELAKKYTRQSKRKAFITIKTF